MTPREAVISEVANDLARMMNRSRAFASGHSRCEEAWPEIGEFYRTRDGIEVLMTIDLLDACIDRAERDLAAYYDNS